MFNIILDDPLIVSDAELKVEPICITDVTSFNPENSQDIQLKETKIYFSRLLKGLGFDVNLLLDAEVSRTIFLKPNLKF